MPQPRAGLALALVLACAALAVAGPALAQQTSQNERCLSCHSRPDLGTVTVNGVTRSLTIDTSVWGSSMHSLLDCTSCHLGFKADTHIATETQDWLWTASVQACGNCHSDQAAIYEKSSHGALAMQRSGDTGAPTCAACHGSHGIMAVGTDTFRKEVTAACERCHASRSQTFLDTYHGKAFLLGRPGTATCYDCHGAHDILPASDPASTISSQHIVATCAKCHDDANKSFASYRVHVDPNSPRSSPLVFLVNAFYIVLIAVVFTFGGIHSALYFYRGFKEGKYRRAHD